MTEILKKAVAEVINENLVEYLDYLKSNSSGENFEDLIKETIETGIIDLVKGEKEISYYCAKNNLYKTIKIILEHHVGRSGVRIDI